MQGRPELEYLRSFAPAVESEDDEIRHGPSPIGARLLSVSGSQLHVRAGAQGAARGQHGAGGPPLTMMMSVVWIDLAFPEALGFGEGAPARGRRAADGTLRSTSTVRGGVTHPPRDD
jgi:hypothetical protein